MNSPIDKLVDDYHDLIDFLLKNNQLSESVEIKDHYRKILLLSCASFYEMKITGILKTFVKKYSLDDKVCEFLSNKAINRQYHTFFDWKQTKNINQFLGLFGETFKNKIAQTIKDDEILSDNISAFLLIGSERNLIVHENFLEYRLEKTFEEIVGLHKKAINFIKFLENELC